MGIYRFSNRVVSGIWNVDCRMRLLSSAPDAVACAVLSAKDAERGLSSADCADSDYQSGKKEIRKWEGVETRSAPASLGATHRTFAFYLGNPCSLDSCVPDRPCPSVLIRGDLNSAFSVFSAVSKPRQNSRLDICAVGMAKKQPTNAPSTRT